MNRRQEQPPEKKNQSKINKSHRKGKAKRFKEKKI
jgi:hypothetical protein